MVTEQNATKKSLQPFLSNHLQYGIKCPLAQCNQNPMDTMNFCITYNIEYPVALRNVKLQKQNGQQTQFLCVLTSSDHVTPFCNTKPKWSHGKIQLFYKFAIMYEFVQCELHEKNDFRKKKKASMKVHP